MDEYDAVLAEKYIQFLSKKLIYCKDDERTSIRNKFEAMARIHLENHFSLLAITMLVESCDQKLENRDLTILRQYETKIKRLDDPMAKILTALILYRSESSQNLDALSLLLEGLEYFPNSVVGNVLHVVLLYETREWMESQVQAEKTLMIIQEFTNLYQIPLAQ